MNILKMQRKGFWIDGLNTVRTKNSLVCAMTVPIGMVWKTM